MPDARLSHQTNESAADDLTEDSGFPAMLASFWVAETKSPGAVATSAPEALEHAVGWESAAPISAPLSQSLGFTVEQLVLTGGAPITNNTTGPTPSRSPYHLALQRRWQPRLPGVASCVVRPRDHAVPSPEEAVDVEDASCPR